MSDSHFARNQLLKHGWTDGCGLGREEHGITEAIKVKIKNNKTGVGHNLGAEFTHHWWDDIFNKTANSIKVEADQAGDVTVTRKSMSSKQSRKAEKERMRKSLYGNFVMGATLKQQDGHQVEEQIDSSSSESEEEIKKPSEEELFEQCGGRTAHKGARHGLKQNGKLLRIQAMETKLLEQMKAANQMSPYLKQSTNESPASKEVDSKQPKSKKKKKSKIENGRNCADSELNCTESELNCADSELNCADSELNCADSELNCTESELNCADSELNCADSELNCADSVISGRVSTDIPKLKKRKKRKHKDIEDSFIDHVSGSIDVGDESIGKKKKRKQKKCDSKSAASNQSGILCEETEIRKKKKKRKDKKQECGSENGEEKVDEQKKKKKNKSKMT